MALSQISKEDILKRIRFDNPWWKSGQILDSYNKMQRRLYFDLFFPEIQQTNIRRAVVLMGSRRVGKTVLLFHSIQKLIESGISSKRICYISIETPIYNKVSLEKLFEFIREAAGIENWEGFYLFFDEIQYLKDWERHLKSLVDSYLGAKFIVSGSAAAALKLKSSESGAGRFTDLILPPLSFYEYLYLKEKTNEINIEVIGNDNEEIKNFEFKVDDKLFQTLNQHFIDYINFGGFPEVALSADIQVNTGQYLKNDIIDKVLMKDLPSLFGIQDIQELNSFFNTIAYNSGNEFSLEVLSKSSGGVAKNTIKKYLEYLEAAFLIKRINRIDEDGRRFKRANFFKIYLTNPSLRSALFSPLNSESEMIGNMVETAVFAQWIHSGMSNLYYARWKNGEVDMVHLNQLFEVSWLAEIKWSNNYYHKINKLKGLRFFMQKKKIQRALVTTIDINETVNLENATLQFVPASVLCYLLSWSFMSSNFKFQTNIFNNL